MCIERWCFLKNLKLLQRALHSEENNLLPIASQCCDRKSRRDSQIGPYGADRCLGGHIGHCYEGRLDIWGCSIGEVISKSSQRLSSDNVLFRMLTKCCQLLSMVSSFFRQLSFCSLGYWPQHCKLSFMLEQLISKEYLQVGMESLCESWRANRF